MRVFILGGTGSIGLAVSRSLVARGDQVLGLARSEASARRLADIGVTMLAGDIRTPETWVMDLPRVDAVVLAATDYALDMGTVDSRLLEALLPVLGAMRPRPRVVYTGGCWLYGQTGDTVATEVTPFDALPAFAWMVPNLTRVLNSREVEGLVVHPAMVYTEDDGVFGRFARAAVAGDAVPVIDREYVRWPLVHRDDLGALYTSVLDYGMPGSSYNGAAVEGLAVGAIARAFAARYQTRDPEPRVVDVESVVAELGEWARGYALDQQMSGALARRELGWRPQHLDPLDDVGRTPRT